MLYSHILKQIDSSAKEVYENLKTGHSEAVYHRAMEVELRLRNINYSSKSPLSIVYKKHVVGYNEPDLIVHVDNVKIVVELKATTYAPRSLEKSQLQSYLRTLDTPLGILINFPQPTSKTKIEGIHIISYGFGDGGDGLNATIPPKSSVIPTLNID